MRARTYAAEAEIEETHWWFVGRRELFARLIGQIRANRDLPVLDVGTSTGSNLRLLCDLGFTRITGLDASAEAVRHCAAKGMPPVQLGDACHMPFADQSFGLVLATDIIEHVDDDGAALAEIERVLMPGGHALITVPAFASLWGPQDRVSEHKRRYRHAGLLARVTGAGLRPLSYFYFNYVLFLPIWMARRILNSYRGELRSENDINTPLLNWLLLKIFRLDVRTAAAIAPPFGVSLLVLAQRDRRAVDSIVEHRAGRVGEGAT
jgi:SAM-dependent methyltransferase